MKGLPVLITAALVVVGVLLFGFGVAGEGSGTQTILGMVFIGGAILFAKLTSGNSGL